MTRPPSLRILLPLSVMLAVTLTVVLTGVEALRQERGVLEAATEAHVREEGARFARLADELLHSRPDLVQSEILLAQAQHDDVRIALVDPEGRIALGGRGYARGQMAAQVLPGWDDRRFERTRQGLEAQLDPDPAAHTTRIMVPYLPPAPPGMISNREKGVVWISHNYQAEQAQRVEVLLLRRLAEWGGMLLFAALLSWWLHRYVGRPLVRIARHAEDAHLIDDYEPLAEDGFAELASLARALNAGVERSRSDRAHLVENNAQLKLAQQVFDSAAEGIVVTDAQSRILAVNPAFCEITGYSASEAVGQKPSMLSSGRQDGAFYRLMYAALERDGRWQGELWNRRKCGELYPEWMTIRALRAPDGRIERFVALFSDQGLIRQAQEEAWRAARVDALTGLPNRQHLIEKLAEAHEGSHALMLLNIDRFKEFNEARGVVAGDELLKTLAGWLEQAAPHALAARLTADEFALLVRSTELREEDEATRLLQLAVALQQALGDGVEAGDETLSLSVSIGIALGEAGDDAHGLLLHAQTALSRARAHGGGQVAFFEQSMGEHARSRYTLQRELRHAISDQQLELYLQPQLDADGRTVGFESLVRWHHPERGLVPPGAFIPLAEESDLIVEMDNWVLEESARTLARLARAGLAQGISVNLSPRHFSQPGFVDKIRTLIRRHGFAARRLTLEITEGLLLESLGAAQEKMATLRQDGVRFSIDDFGTGYSSLAYLKSLPIDELKIDQRFIRPLPGSEEDGALVDGIVSIARSLRFTVVAEGVETAGQRDYLKRYPGLLQQGYLHGRPMPAPQALLPLLEPLATTH
ncbi:GGDEF domain-containing phosphodiesterase [Crenobacter caeni]|uniref:EAL domain-containing protein n=1 Tax=Crenobacter caeni TaxID=2705474 RepID=A0A6B2KSS0_9NEIS|nr:GGDEF domain-containing phosphodiesterase [Crenobacter caeni]NDV13120.1 EAL domain-containing protein [Crenobacter caeni]